jgi:site-specific recombinase XerD
MFNTKLTLLKNSKYATGLFPVMLRVSKKGTTSPTYISTGVTALETQWSKNDGRLLKNFTNHNTINNKLNTKLTNARKLAQEIETENAFVSLAEFKTKYKDLERRKFKFDYNLFEYIEKRINEITVISTRENYQGLVSSIKQFSPTKREFSDFNPEHLDRFVTHLQVVKKNQSNTVWEKMTTLKATYNHATKNGYCPHELNPFSKYSISKMKKETVKRALDADQFKAIEELDLTMQPLLITTRHYAVFSYYTRGMNFKDMAFLKWENVKGNKIIYDRNKTGGLFKIKILPPVRKILDYFQSIQTTDYIFPIMPAYKMTPKQTRSRMNSQRAKAKRHLDSICVLCDIPENVTMYWFRHTFATQLLRKKVDLDLARQALGHSSLVTTQVYLKSLSHDELDDAIESVLM